MNKELKGSIGKEQDGRWMYISDYMHRALRQLRLRPPSTERCRASELVSLVERALKKHRIINTSNESFVDLSFPMATCIISEHLFRKVGLTLEARRRFALPANFEMKFSLYIYRDFRGISMVNALVNMTNTVTETAEEIKLELPLNPID